MKKRLALFAVVVLLCTLCTVPAHAAVSYEWLLKVAKQNEEMAAGDVGKIDEMLDYEMAAYMYETAATLAPDKESEAECYLNAARVYMLLAGVSHEGPAQEAYRNDAAAEKYELVAEITGEYEYYYGLAAQLHLGTIKTPKRCDMAAVDYELIAERTGNNEYYIKAAEIHLEAIGLTAYYPEIMDEYEMAAKDYELAGEPELADKMRRNSMAFMLSDGYPEIVYGIGGLAVGFFAAMLIFRRKKVAVSSTTEDEE